uniref:Peroxidase n=1 Tax=Panagrolaimus sp. PS1159 TaxID=55785 RepID=A0AC35GWR1_9BILA
MRLSRLLLLLPWVISFLVINVYSLRDQNAENCRLFGECDAIADSLPEFSENIENEPVINKITFKIPHQRSYSSNQNEIQWAQTKVEELFNRTEPLILENMSEFDKNRQAPSNFWAAHTLSTPAAREKSFPALVALLATKRIAKSKNVIPNELDPQLEAICPRDTVQYCENRKYRTFDGSCNNIANPMWGATYSPMQRFIDADYGDGISALRASKHSKQDLPNVRYLSTVLFREPFVKQDQLTTLVPHFAQFIFNDMVHIASVQLTDGGGEKQIPIPCCHSGVHGLRHPECASIRIPKNDKRLSDFVDCMPYPRTITAAREGCPLGPREQANSATSFLDASTIYGSTKQKAKQLRAFRNGQLLTTSKASFGDIFPTTIDPIKTTFSSICAPSAGHSCFFSGSEHVNFLPTSAALHTIWIRQHNNIANQLLVRKKL